MPSLDSLQQMLATDPTDPFLLYGIAQEHAKAGDYAEAIQWYARCIEADPTYAYAYYHKARAHAAAGDTPAAMTTIASGLKAAAQSGDHHAIDELHTLRETLG